MYIRIHNYVTPIFLDSTSTSENQFTSQDLPRSDHVTVHSTAAGEQSLVYYREHFHLRIYYVN